MAHPRTVDPEGRESGSARVQIRLTPSQRAALNAAAEREGVTLAELIRSQVINSLPKLDKCD